MNGRQQRLIGLGHDTCWGGGGGRGRMTIGAVTGSIDRECCQLTQYRGAKERMAVDSWGVRPGKARELGGSEG